ncbi:MAG: hypothetical protein JW827_10775 [Spirochaetes bacterium]|nr:hypothetical protein [Spirochaetota bacterium]
MKNDQLVELVTYYDLAQFGKIEAVLKQYRIKFLNRSFLDSAYNGIYTLKHGLGKIFIFPADEKKAKKILKQEGLL